MDLRARGITPGELHHNAEHGLPCADDCDYLDGWQDVVDADVLIGHPTHAYVTEVIRDRVVVFDEDPGEAFRLAFDANDIHRISSEFLADPGALPWQDSIPHDPPATLDGLKEFRETAQSEHLQSVLEELRGEELFQDSGCVGRTHGHGAARAISLVYLEPDRTDLGNAVEKVELPGAMAVHDDAEGVLYIRRPPDLSRSAGVLALDGTPVKRIWEGRLGLSRDDFGYTRVLCDSCRETYLSDVLGYEVYQTTTHIKPYSSGHAFNREKDLALIEAIYRETGVRPPVISSKRVVEDLEVHSNFIGKTGYYNAIKGSNRFSSEADVGLVIGSPHPGDHEVKRLAALNGDSITIPDTQLERGKNLDYRVHRRAHEPSNPYLSHFREQRVVQAIFRFGRNQGATVYVHTSAVPDWILTAEPPSADNAVFRRARSAGEQQVLAAIRAGAETPSEIIERVEIKQSTVYDRLKDLRTDGIIQNVADQRPARYELLREDAQPADGHLVQDSWYVTLPDAR